MSRILAFFAFIAAALTVASPVQAQSVANKILCEGTVVDGPCHQMTGTPKLGDPVYYQFVLYAGASPVALPVSEDFPPNFAFLNPGNPILCKVTDGPGTGNNVPLSFVAGSQPLQFTATLDPGQEATCTMEGAFITSGGTAVNTVSTAGSSDSETTVISTSTRFDADLKITKELLVPVLKPLNISGSAQTARYRITVTTDELVYLGDFFRVYDQLALFPNGVSVNANLLPGSTCSLQNSGVLTNCILASNFNGEVLSPAWKDFAAWGIASGSVVALQPGDALIIEYGVEYSVPADVSCVKDDDAEGIRNRAFLGLAGSTQALRDDSDGNNDTAGNSDSDLPLVTGVYNVDPACAALPPPGPASTLQLDKIATHISSGSSPPPVQPWPGTGNYVITLSNPDPSTEIFDVEIADIMENQPGTPNFRARLIRAQWAACLPATSSCIQTNPNPPTTPGASGPLRSFESYYDRHTMWTGSVDSVTSDQVQIKLQAYLHSVDCDYAPLLGPKTIRNWVEVRHKMRSIDPVSGLPVVTSHMKRDYADIQVSSPPACQVKVEKTSLPTVRGNRTFPVDQMIFDEWKPYQVKFTALPTAQGTLKIGTLIDAIRIENAFYASGMALEYQWQCNDLSNGGVRGFQNSGNGTAAVNHVSAPHQGVRIMDHPGIVEFDPGSTLQCNVRVKVQQPSKNDPFCLSQGQPMLQNLALMDGSRYFNANMPWPHAPQGTSWDTSADKLAQCYNLIVNKNASTGVVAPSGGPVTFRVQVTNANQPGTGGDIDFPDGAAAAGYAPYFSDRFRDIPSSNTVRPVAPPVYTANNHCPGTPTKRCEIFQAGGVDNYGITKLRAQESLTIEYTVDGPYEPDQFCNYARGWGGGDNRQWYEYYLKDPATWDSEACVLVRGSLVVNKRALTPPWITFDPATQFTIKVECDTPSGFGDIKRTLAVSGNAPASSITQIPIGSTCEIEEVNLPDPDQWGECEWRDPAYTEGDTVLIDGTADPHQLYVLNQLDCEAPAGGELTILKELVSLEDCPTINALCTFRITVTNNSTAPVAGPIEITDVFSNGQTPPGYYYVPNMPGPLMAPWACSQPTGGNQPVGCIADPINLMPGQSTTFEITFDMPNAGTNCALLETPLQNPKPESCVDVGTVKVDLSNLVVTKMKNPNQCPGSAVGSGLCNFTIRISNSGSADFTGPLSFDDVITGGAAGAGSVSIVSYSPSGWTCIVVDAVTTRCSNPGVWIPAGTSIDISLNLNLAYAAPVEENCANIGQVDPIGRLIKSCVPIYDLPPVSAPELTLTKSKISTETCLTGALTCHFRFDIENTGTAGFTGPLTFEDQFLNGTGYSNLSIQSITPSGWACTLAQTTWTCTNPSVSIAQGTTHTVDIIFDYGPGFSARRNCARLVQGTAKGPDSCVNIRDMRIVKELVSASNCAVTGNRQCTFRITLQNASSGMHTGPMLVTDAVDFGGVPQNLPLAGGATNGWTCLVGGSGAGLDCTHPGPVFPSSGIASFEMTMDLSSMPPMHLGNCAEIADPVQQTRQRSCVQLAPIWDPPARMMNSNDLPRVKRRLLEEAVKAAGAIAKDTDEDADEEVEEKDGKRRGFRLPRVRINIGGISVGGGKRRTDEPEEKETPERRPREETGGDRRDPNGNQPSGASSR